MSLQKGAFWKVLLCDFRCPEMFCYGMWAFDPGFVTKFISCSYDTYWSIYARKSTKSWIFTNSMPKIDLDFGRISKTSFLPNPPSLSPSTKKLVRHIKKRKTVKGVTPRWSIQNRKNYNNSSHRSTCRGVNVLSPFDAYLRIYSYFSHAPN